MLQAQSQNVGFVPKFRHRLSVTGQSTRWLPARSMLLRQDRNRVQLRHSPEYLLLPIDSELVAEEYVGLTAVNHFREALGRHL